MEFNQGNCWNCGQPGHSTGDDNCQQPEAQLNMPPQLTQYLNKRGTKQPRPLNADGADDPIDQAYGDADTRHKKHIIAYLEAQLRNAKSAYDVGVEWNPIY